MNLTIINCTGDTFTPTKSGAIATWVWEICNSAARDGIEPLVITRNNAAMPYPWGRKILLDYPAVPPVRGMGRLFQFEQKLSGWGHIRQGIYARMVADTIRGKDAAGSLLLHNDIELAVYLRDRFPEAFIVHHFHNVNTCSERFRSRFAASVDVATAVSDYCARANEKYFGMQPGSIRTVLNGVDTERYQPPALPARGLPVINFVGRTDHQKAPDLLLRAALLLAEKTKAFKVQVLGSRFYGWSEPDAYQHELDGLASMLGAAGIEVRRPGFVDRNALPGELRNAHIHVIPSRWDDPCALTIFEGMATGLPTVASCTGGTPEVLGDAGFLFGRNSVGELASHLEKLVLNESLRVEYGRKARIRAEELTWDKTWSGFREIFSGNQSRVQTSLAEFA